VKLRHGSTFELEGQVWLVTSPEEQPIHVILAAAIITPSGELTSEAKFHTPTLQKRLESQPD
jgi:hypothetical protein